MTQQNFLVPYSQNLSSPLLFKPLNLKEMDSLECDRDHSHEVI